MRTPQGWVISMPTSLAEDLAWSLVVLAGEHGLAAVSFRALARHTRLAPGTITNHYGSKPELFGVCATVIGRWLAYATTDHVEDRGAIGLFPAPDDLTYRLLVSVWAQLRAYALTDATVDQRVRDMTPMLQRSVRDASLGLEEDGSAAWVCLEGLRQELVRPGSALTPADALAVLEQVIGRRDRADDRSGSR
jgi:AcrR family transcriptional regulator